MKYLTIQHQLHEKLDEMVNEKLAEGWELYEGQVVYINNGVSVRAQVVIKLDDSSILDTLRYACEAAKSIMFDNENVKESFNAQLDRMISFCNTLGGSE